MEQVKEEKSNPDIDEIDANDSVLSVMVEKCDEIKQSISLIKKEIVEQTTPQSVNGSSNKLKQTDAEYDGLVNLLSDSKVSSIIKNVAGEDAHKIVANALSDVDSGRDRKEVLTEGLQKLKLNLSRADKSSIHNDPTFKLALNLVGLNRRI